MQRFIGVFRGYMLIVATPCIVVAVGLGCSLVAMAVVGHIEQVADRRTPFDLEIPCIGHPRFFIVALGGQLLFSAIVVAKSVLVSFRYGWNQFDWMVPLAQVTGAQLAWVGASFLGFYPVRHLILMGAMP